MKRVEVMIDWLSDEQGLTSPPTQYRLYGRRFFTGHKTQPTVSKYWRRYWDLYYNVIYYAMLLLNKTDPKTLIFVHNLAAIVSCSVLKTHVFGFMYNFSATVGMLHDGQWQRTLQWDSRTSQNKYNRNNQSACHITHIHNCDNHMSFSKSNQHRSVHENQSDGHTGIKDIVWYWVTSKYDIVLRL